MPRISRARSLPGTLQHGTARRARRRSVRNGDPQGVRHPLTLALHVGERRLARARIGAAAHRCGVRRAEPLSEVLSVPRNVFFSFDYDDIMGVNVVRFSDVVLPDNRNLPFRDRSMYEEAKKTPNAIRRA